MTKLKSAEKYLDNNYLIETFNTENPLISDIIKQVQLDAIQATVEMCVEEAKIIMKPHMDYYYEDYVEGIDKQSILNVADKMVKELNNQ